MIKINDKKDCCGCFSCANICPKECIALVPDDEGFVYPQVDMKLCVNCNLCNNSCPVIVSNMIDNSPSVYGCYNKDEAIRQNSTSGGVFYLLCECVIKQNGVVFGAKFDNSFNLYHTYAETLEDCKAFMGSKYVQSVIGNCYCQAKNFLDDNRVVLFTGTPCQIAGLYTFLKKDYDNLYTQDIVCHSVPSPQIWNEYKEYAGNGRIIKDIKFRSKETGWKNSSFHICFDNGEEISEPYAKNDYIKGFVNGLYSRPSCYECKFSGISRKSDITLGDFWGVDTFSPELFDDIGTSIVLVNSKKGKKLFSFVQKKLKCKKVDIEKAVWYNKAICSSAIYNDNRNRFFIEKDKNLKDRINDNLVTLKTDIHPYIPSFFERIKRKIKNIMTKRN